MTAPVSSLCDDNHREPWIRERSVRRKRSDPTALTNTCSGLTYNRLCWIIRLPSRAVVDGTNHSRNHALPDFIGDRQLASYFYTHLVRFFGAVRDLRDEQLAAIGHRGNERSELERRHFETVGM